MRTLTCITIDDEEGAHRILKNYIEKIEGLECEGSFLNALDAFHYLKKAEVDIIFLDINMPEISGYTFVRMLSKPPKIIITSAYPEYALEGFELDVLDYLLKPMRLERFVKAVEKARNSIENVSQKIVGPETIEVKYEGETKQFQLKDILYFQSVGNYIKIVTATKNYVVHVTTKTIESMLINTDFFRIHKSYIVNKNHIKGIENETVLIGDQKLPIGKTFKKYLEVFLAKNQ